MCLFISKAWTETWTCFSLRMLSLSRAFYIWLHSLSWTPYNELLIRLHCWCNKRITLHRRRRPSYQVDWMDARNNCSCCRNIAADQCCNILCCDTRWYFRSALLSWCNLALVLDSAADDRFVLALKLKLLLTQRLWHLLDDNKHCLQKMMWWSKHTPRIENHFSMSLYIFEIFKYFGRTTDRKSDRRMDKATYWCCIPGPWKMSVVLPIEDQLL